MLTTVVGEETAGCWGKSPALVIVGSARTVVKTLKYPNRKCIQSP
jgi:hypothetical protein